MDRFTIACVQMNALRGDLDHNLDVHQRIARGAAGEGCNLIVFPELSATSHYGGEDVTELAEEAGRGPIYEAMRDLSAELETVIGYGFCEQAQGTFYNSYALMGPKGMLGLQRKVHASRDEYFSFRMGGSFELFDLGFCRAGVAVCFDASFFEVWRVFALRGAEVLLLPHAGRSGWGEEIPEEEQIKHLKNTLERLPGRYGIYAEDNALFAAYANQVAYNGHSTHSGGAYVLSPDGKLVSTSGPRLDDLWISAELDPNLLAQARNSRFSVLRTRRPEVYGDLARMF
jgi:predicted amidohydrolase